MIAEGEYPGYQFLRDDGWIPLIGPEKNATPFERFHTFWGLNSFTMQIGLGYFDERGEFMNFLHRSEPEEMRITHVHVLDNEPDPTALDIRQEYRNRDWVDPELGDDDA